ncbi:MAG: transglycosylase domain-containing protein [Firmicutes bacterium]|nr:transglycosylase domain-containing protein [Bacillota bacterium]
MRTDRDQRTDKEQEIDDFLSQFDTPLDDFTTDINSYLNDSTSTKYTAARTFHGVSPAPERANRTPAANTEVRSSARVAGGNGGNGNNGNGGNKRKKEKLSKSEANAQKKAKKAQRKQALKGASLKERLLALVESLFLKENPNYDPTQGSHIIVNGKKRKNKPMRISLKKIIRDCFVAGCTVALGCFIYAFVIISLAPKVDADDIYATVEQSSAILDDQGKQVDTIYYTQDRKLIKYADCPEDLVNAFVAIEDKTFWNHHGFNWTRMIGAVLKSLVGGGGISGTSTITQQLARNIYLPDTKSVRSIKRKILEMHYASQIERCLSKEEIIEAYMNTIYLGFGCYGVEAASKAYFSKSAKDLSLVECAALASLPPAPEAYALVKYADASTLADNTENIITRTPETYIANDITKDRRALTLYLMKDQGYINDKQYNENKDKDLIDFIKPTFKSGTSTYAYFHEYLIDEVINDLMKKYDYTYAEAEKMVYTGGLQIYSTLDSTAQKVIVKEFNDSSNFPALAYYSTDSNKNIITSSGSIQLYAYSTYFNSDKSFTIKESECTVNSDGSVTIKRGKRLNIYTTEYNGITDYSLEFKQMYLTADGTFYSIPGGYINIPAEYKSLDKNNDLVIAAEYFDNNNGIIKIAGNTVVVTQDAYSLQQKVIQPQAAMTITDVATGQIKAMVGGRKMTGQRLYNRCIYPRQPGSSIKPLTVYAAAIQKSCELANDGKTFSYTNFGYDKQGTKGYGSYLTASSVFVDEPMIVNGRQWPKNAEGGFSGTQTMRTALQQSLNTCAVKCQVQVGSDYSIDLLQKFGITTAVTAKDNNQTNDENTAALALGGMARGVTPLDMAEAYAAFPNGGVRNTPTAYTKVTDRNGKVILESKSEQVQVLDPGVAWIMVDMLQSVVTQGIARSAYGNGVQTGGKTGTTSNQYDIWMDGFTPSYSASLWIGVDSNIKLTSMSGPACRLWGKIIRQIPAANKGSYKGRPSNVLNVAGEWYTSGTEKGRSTYIADEEKKKEEEEKKKQEEEERRRQEEANRLLVAAVDAYIAENECTLEEACAACSTTVDAYYAAGGTYGLSEQNNLTPMTRLSNLFTVRMLLQN